jgi:hypothetical protein
MEDPVRTARYVAGLAVSGLVLAVASCGGDDIDERAAKAKERRREAESVRRSVTKVCDGATVPQAAARPTGKLALVGYEGADFQFDISDDERMNAWLATRLADVHVVACISNDSQRLGSCRYTDEPYPGAPPGVSTRDVRITRVRERVSIDVREAQSGKRVGTRAFAGARPKRCPRTVDYGANTGSCPGTEYPPLSSDCAFVDAVDSRKVFDWLSRWRTR